MEDNGDQFFCSVIEHMAWPTLQMTVGMSLKEGGYASASGLRSTGMDDVMLVESGRLRSADSANLIQP